MENWPTLHLKILHPKAHIPTRKTAGAAGYDLYAAQAVTIKPYALAVKVPLGFAIELPEGMEMEIRGRSGLNAKTGLRTLQGTIDWDYRGEVCAIFDNLSDDELTIEPGQRIAQGVFKFVALPLILPTLALSDTQRGADGFGSTGK
jgi:dUTP pyrophosphatase